MSPQGIINPKSKLCYKKKTDISYVAIKQYSSQLNLLSKFKLIEYFKQSLFYMDKLERINVIKF